MVGIVGGEEPPVPLVVNLSKHERTSVPSLLRGEGQGEGDVCVLLPLDRIANEPLALSLSKGLMK
jgi:hypothetical protein